MNTQIVCVLRSIDGISQWVAASGRRDLVPNEKVMIGFFDSFEVRTGPSDSHVHTCYEPRRGGMVGALDINEFLSSSSSSATEVGSFKTCVVRFVGKQQEYVEALGRVDLVAGEALISGRAVPSTVKSGPSGSHIVTVWTFIGSTHRDVLSSQALESEDVVHFASSASSFKSRRSPRSDNFASNPLGIDGAGIVAGSNLVDLCDAPAARQSLQ
jgi:hypothetical protein